MATRKRPIALTAAALASAATVVAATPDLMSSRDLSIASAPSPTRLSNASYDLTAFADITIAGISDAYWFGWGGYVGCGTVNAQGQCTNVPADIYYPQLKNIYVSGVSGVAYYLIDQLIDQFTADFDLDNYYFEVGSQNFGIPNANYSGAGALIYVGIGETFGTDSQLFQAAQTIFYYGVTNVVNQAIVSLATLVPQIQLGPLTVGGGILASLYYYGITPDQTFQANSIGLPAIWAYISTALTGLVSPAAATPESAAATALAAAAATVTDEITPAAKSAVGELKTEATAPVAETPAADAGKTAETVTAETVAEAAVGVSTPAAETTTTTEAATTTEATATTEAATTTTTETAAAGAGATAGDSTSGKTTKPKAQNPIGKIAGKIKAALGGSDSDTGGKHRTDRSSKSGKASESTSSADSASSAGGSSSNSSSDK